MTVALFPGGLNALREFCSAPFIVALDFDGTVAPIVDDPSEATIPTARRRKIRALRRCVPVAVISGRAHADVSARLGGVPADHVVGGHGLDWGDSPRAVDADIAALRVQLTTALRSAPGVQIEDKGTSLTVHFRRAAEPTAALAAVDAVLGHTPHPHRRVDGKDVVNVLPDGGGHKGDALIRLCGIEGVERAVFVGDDLTDEDAFAVSGPVDVFGVRVGRPDASRAPFYVASMRQVDRLLDVLVSIGSPSRG